MLFKYLHVVVFRFTVMTCSHTFRRFNIKDLCPLILGEADLQVSKAQLYGICSAVYPGDKPFSKLKMATSMKVEQSTDLFACIFGDERVVSRAGRYEN